MKKVLFVKIDYDDEKISVEDIRSNLHLLLSECPEKIDVRMFKSMTEEQADYVVYSIKDNPI